MYNSAEQKKMLFSRISEHFVSLWYNIKMIRIRSKPPVAWDAGLSLRRRWLVAEDRTGAELACYV